MDDLTQIKGIGRATAKKLAVAGFDTFEKLAHDGIAGEHGIEAAWIAEAARLHHENTEGKPRRPDDEHGTVDGAPADGGAGDPHTNNPEGSSGTAREAPSTDGGTAAATPNVGTQSGSPHTTGGGGAASLGAAAGALRRFAVISTVMLDGVISEPGGEPVSLTRGGFDELLKAQVISGTWEDGEPA